MFIQATGAAPQEGKIWIHYYQTRRNAGPKFRSGISMGHLGDWTLHSAPGYLLAWECHGSQGLGTSKNVPKTGEVCRDFCNRRNEHHARDSIVPVTPSECAELSILRGSYHKKKRAKRRRWFLNQSSSCTSLSRKHMIMFSIFSEFSHDFVDVSRRESRDRGNAKTVGMHPSGV